MVMDGTSNGIELMNNDEHGIQLYQIERIIRVWVWIVLNCLLTIVDLIEVIKFSSVILELSNSRRKVC